MRSLALFFLIMFPGMVALPFVLLGAAALLADGHNPWGLIVGGPALLISLPMYYVLLVRPDWMGY